MTKKLFYTLICLIVLAGQAHASVSCAGGDCTVTCDGSGDVADLNTAIAGVSTGGTISIVAGTCVITAAPSTITRAMTIQGAGMDSTHFVVSGQGRALTISPSGNPHIVIKGIHFDQSNVSTGQLVMISPSGESNQIRFTENKVEAAGTGLFLSGWIEMLIDNNLFLNNERAIYLGGDHNTWSRPIVAGTLDSTFVEHNDFIFNNNFNSTAFNEPEQPVYHADGFRSTIRYNTFDASALDCDFVWFDSHGNWGGGSDPLTAYRGQPLIEVYGNTILGQHTYRGAEIRGGSVIFWDNHYTFSGSYTHLIDLTEEECWSVAVQRDTDGWSAQDQVFNSFFWNNTINGNPLSVSLRKGCDSEYIQNERDYFLHAPQSTGGKETWLGSPGQTGTLSTTDSGPNAYYPYTPYGAHPLATGAPVLNTATIGTNGTSLTLSFSKAVTQGAGYNNSDLDLDCSAGGNNIALTYSSGDGTATHVYTIASTVYQGESCNVDFNGDANSLEDSGGNDLAAIVSKTVVNSSTQPPPGGDSTPPTLSSAVIGTNGQTLTLTFSELVTQGAGYANSHWDLDCSIGGNNIAVTYSSGNGTATHVYLAAVVVKQGETCNIDFSGSSNSEEDAAGNDLATIASGSVTNNSYIEPPPTPPAGLIVGGGGGSIAGGGSGFTSP